MCTGLMLSLIISLSKRGISARVITHLFFIKTFQAPFHLLDLFSCMWTYIHAKRIYPVFAGDLVWTGDLPFFSLFSERQLLEKKGRKGEGGKRVERGFHSFDTPAQHCRRGLMFLSSCHKGRIPTFFFNFLAAYKRIAVFYNYAKASVSRFNEPKFRCPFVPVLSFYNNMSVELHKLNFIFEIQTPPFGIRFKGFLYCLVINLER